MDKGGPIGIKNEITLRVTRRVRVIILISRNGRSQMIRLPAAEAPPYLLETVPMTFMMITADPVPLGITRVSLP